MLGDDAGGFARDLIEEHEGELDEETQGNLFALVQKMTVMQKIKLARMGNKEARGLLVRDRNKLVATAAIRSPKVTENEVETFAKARNLSDEVLRMIASNREWTRSYHGEVRTSRRTRAARCRWRSSSSTSSTSASCADHEEQGRALGGVDATPADSSRRRERSDGRGQRASRGTVNARIVYWGIEGAGQEHQPARRSTRSCVPTTAASSRSGRRGSTRP